MTPDDARSALRDLFVHDVNNKQAILRAATAAGYGLPAETVAGLARPYPGSQVATNITTHNNPAGGLVKAAMLGASLMAGGGAGGVLLSHLLKPATEAVTQPKAEAKPSVVRDRVYDLDVKMSLEPKE